MLCFEVFVNDKKVCTAGHEELDKITTSLLYQKNKGTVTLSINGELIKSDSINEYAEWLILAEKYSYSSRRDLKIGDEVKIIINGDTKPDKPAIHKSGKEVTKFGTNIYCSFCSKNQKEAKKIIAGPLPGPKIYICNDCIDLCNEIIEYESKS